ncbi:MAG: Fic family protein [Micrococcus sp.]|nr:Fic family protein [Micrococcus sp.]
MSNAPSVNGFAIGWEDRPWHSDMPPAGAMSRRARLASRGPYRAAVAAEIAELPVGLSAETGAAAEDALVEISRFDAELDQGLPGAEPNTRLELAPLAAVLLRTESASSSQIENVTAGAKALALATLHEKTGPNATQVVANVEAMQRALDLSDELSRDSILSVHAALMAGQHHAQPGQFRSGQVWIGSHAPTPHLASFVPPHADRVEQAIADLLAFGERTDVPVLAHVAITHAQFETIHPFADGNGRTGRALVHTMLRRAGATRRLTVPVSAGLLADTGAYFDALTAYREGDLDPIVARFSDAAFAGVSNGRTLAADLRAILGRWSAALTARRHAAVWRILPLLIGQPAITVRFVQERAAVSQPAAQHAIDQLLDAGVVTPATTGRRNRVWVAEEVVSALDDFAARARRR